MYIYGRWLLNLQRNALYQHQSLPEPLPESRELCWCCLRCPAYRTQTDRILNKKKLIWVAFVRAVLHKKAEIWILNNKTIEAVVFPRCRHKHFRLKIINNNTVYASVFPHCPDRTQTVRILNNKQKYKRLFSRAVLTRHKQFGFEIKNNNISGCFPALSWPDTNSSDSK
jgi:hypothetical protein